MRQRISITFFGVVSFLSLFGSIFSRAMVEEVLRGNGRFLWNASFCVVSWGLLLEREFESSWEEVFLWALVYKVFCSNSLGLYYAWLELLFIIVWLVLLWTTFLYALIFFYSSSMKAWILVKYTYTLTQNTRWRVVICRSSISLVLPLNLEMKCNVTI